MEETKFLVKENLMGRKYLETEMWAISDDRIRLYFIMDCDYVNWSELSPDKAL
jgi:hypothetical protein